MERAPVPPKAATRATRVRQGRLRLRFARRRRAATASLAARRRAEEARAVRVIGADAAMGAAAATRPKIF
jgi:hypothetical protein